MTDSHSSWNILVPKCLQSETCTLSVEAPRDVHKVTGRDREVSGKSIHLKSGLSILVPAFNEEKTILYCVKDIIQTLDGSNLGYEIIIVDDGSRDKTFELAKDAPEHKSNSIKVVCHNSNSGKGHAIMTGLSLATKYIIVIQDADMEYSSKNIPALIEPILKEKADVVYGSRFIGQMDHMSLSHLLGNKVLTFFTNLLYNCKLTDVMTGHKAFRKTVLEQIEINSYSFEFEVEVTAKILERGFKIVELPTSYTRRKTGEAKIRWIDGVKCLTWLIYYKISSLFSKGIHR